MEWWETFTWGLIGAVSPEVIRAYLILRETNDFYYPKKLILITILLAALGGVIAIAFESATPLNAILIGFATPTIVSTYAGSSPRSIPYVLK